MTRNAGNERIKREYFRYLMEAMGRDAATIDAVAQSLARFEESTRFRDFRKFHREQAVAFKRRLSDATNAKTGQLLSKSTVLATLRHLRSFFFWLAHQPGFKAVIAYSDADYFNLSDKEVAIARAHREKRVPSLKQVEHVLSEMPSETAVQRRDRALISFATLTAARVGALASLRLRHVNLEQGYVDQDARTVLTKFSKSFRTYFMPVSETALRIIDDWVDELQNVHWWGPDDPLFPSTEMRVDDSGAFAAAGLERRCWSSTGPIRDVFKRAFKAAGLPYFNPHSFRDMIVRHAMTLDLSPEEMKAWSQNLGHQDVLTTLTSYGAVPSHRQGELIRNLARKSDQRANSRVMADVIEALQKNGIRV